MPLNFHEQKCNFDIADCKYTDQRCSFFVLLQFDVHFVGFGWGNFKILPPCWYNYLRKVHFTGFNGIKGQREFLLHIVENAPALKVLTIDPKKKLGLCNCKPSDFVACRAKVRSELKGKLSPGTEVNIL